MRRSIALAALLSVTSTAAVAAEYSVTWYADHPDIAAGVLKLCRDRASLAHNPNCINAEEAGTLIVGRQLTAAGDIGNLLSPQYWQTHPRERSQELWICNSIDKQHATPDATTARMCLAARGG
jgi:hypothetical protein